MEEEKKIQLARDMADIFEFTFQLRQKLSQLSQGQRQKILLASELINHPEIILLDEPFNHLDPFTRREILSALFKYIRQRELTVIWVTHDRNEALRFADEIGLLNFGRIEQISVPEKIVFRPRNIFVAQFMGFENFIAVSKKTGNLWLTPWGLQELSFNSNFNEALLIIPHDAWEYDADQTIMFKVLDKKIQYHHWEMTLEWEEKRFNAGLPHSLKALLSEPKLSLRPRWSECFLVSL
jgi:ABC-type Fe3+/spermidine/putrescine transport system ATPase subunit